VSRAWVLVLLLIVGCTSPAAPSPSAQPAGAVGGTLRVGLWVDAEADPELGRWLLDPQRFFWHPFARCCLLRTLLSYEGRPIEDGGAQLRPDLAEAMPEVSPDGLTWTFHLRAGLRYGPPFEDREIVAGDFITALERTVRVGESPYHDVIEGVSAFRDGEAGTVAGAQAPDDRTLVFRLPEQAGDFGNRVAMPYLAPIPAEALAEHDEDYAGFLVASGPYMLEGADALDHADPEATPIWDLDTLALVRNPSWTAATDPLRPAYPDRIEIVRARDRGMPAVRSVVAGEFDVLLDPMPSSAREEVVADAVLRPRLREGPWPNLFYIPLNLAQPPFDDVAVRRAANAAIDREALIGTFHTEAASRFAPAGHAFPAVAVGGLLRDYATRWAEGGGGDADLARELMRGSAHDTDGDGRCDGDACAVLGNRIGDTTDEAVEIIESNLAEIGITVTWVEEPFMADPTGHIGLAAVLGWVADYPSANDFAGLLSEPAVDGLNLSLVGATPDQLSEWGYEVASVPSLDAKVAACRSRGGSAAFACWAELDQLLTEQVVAWVPVATSILAHVISDRIDHFEFSGSEAMPAIDRISLRREDGQ
jgi:peptide/nickel transport system substrate-binding protein